MPPLAELRRCSRSYDNGRIVALDDVSFSLARGELVAVTGPSGSGKSTLLSILCGMEEPSTGEVLFDGRQITGQSNWARIRSDRIGFVFQSFNLISSLTVSENIELAMMWRGMAASARKARILSLLERFGLADRLNERPVQLSGGERQRVAIARALANSPDLIAADEPTGSLDSRSSGEIIDLLAELHRESGKTVVIVTHDRSIAECCARRVEVVDGRIVSDVAQTGRGGMTA